MISHLDASRIGYRVLFDDGKQGSLLRERFQLEARRDHTTSWHPILWAFGPDISVVEAMNKIGLGVLVPSAFVTEMLTCADLGH